MLNLNYGDNLKEESLYKNCYLNFYYSLENVFIKFFMLFSDLSFLFYYLGLVYILNGFLVVEWKEVYEVKENCRVIFLYGDL